MTQVRLFGQYALFGDAFLCFLASGGYAGFEGRVDGCDVRFYGFQSEEETWGAVAELDQVVVRAIL